MRAPIPHSLAEHGPYTAEQTLATVTEQIARDAVAGHLPTPDDAALYWAAYAGVQRSALAR